jgi:PAS domain S-box-containing protein
MDSHNPVSEATRRPSETTPDIGALQAGYRALEAEVVTLKAAVQKRLSYEQMLSACSQVLLTSGEREEAITETLYEIMAATDTSRVYLCKNHHEDQSGRLYFNQTHEMCALDVSPLATDSTTQQCFYEAGLTRWEHLLSLGGAVAGSRQTLESDEMRFLEMRQAESVLLLPLWVEGQWYGFVGIDDKNPRDWPTADSQLLQTVVDMVGSYIGRNRAELALIDSEEKYRTLIEQSSDAIFLIYGGCFELVNERFTEMFGIFPEDVQRPGFMFSNIVAAEAGSVLDQNNSLSQQAAHRPPYEFVALNRDGKVINVELTVSYPSYKGGIATQGILRDITERKRHEEERRQAYEQIQRYAGELAMMVREEKRQRKIASILAEVVASVSLTLTKDVLLDRILVHLKELVPYDGAAVYWVEGELLSLEAASGEQVDFESIPASNALFDEMKRQKNFVMILDTQQEEALQPLFGSERARSWIGAPLIVAQQTMGYLSVYREQPGLYTSNEGDLVQAFAHQVAQTIFNTRLFTELKETQAQLVRQERLAVLGKMAATIAHELRNPLMSLRMGVEYLTLDISEDTPQYRGAMLVQSNIDRIVRVTENILHVARTPRLSPSWGILTDLIQQELFRWQYKLDQKNITCHLDLTPNLGPLYFDHEQVGRALSNLINNSIEAMKHSGTLTVTLSTENNHQVVAVTDNGSGISEEDMVTIFDPFFTTKPNGTGLGLAIVKQIVDGHNGTLNVWSEVGRGTTISIYLPEVQQT